MFPARRLQISPKLDAVKRHTRSLYHNADDACSLVNLHMDSLSAEVRLTDFTRRAHHLWTCTGSGSATNLFVFQKWLHGGRILQRSWSPFVKPGSQYVLGGLVLSGLVVVGTVDGVLPERKRCRGWEQDVGRPSSAMRSVCYQ